MSGRDDDLMQGRANQPGAPGPSAAETDAVRGRQRARATVMAWLLGGFVVLVFAIAIVKMKLGQG